MDEGSPATDVCLNVSAGSPAATVLGCDLDIMLTTMPGKAGTMNFATVTTGIHKLAHVINPWHTRAMRVTVLGLFICMSLCLSVRPNVSATMLSVTICNKLAKEQYQLVRCYTGLL